jgi:hypothetical protein
MKKLKLAKSNYKLEQMYLNAKLSHMVHTSFGLGVYVHNVKQPKKVKLSKASHLGLSSTLICK